MKHNIFFIRSRPSGLPILQHETKVTVEYKDYRPLNMSSFVTFQRNILLDTPTEESRIQDFHIGRLLFAQERIYVIDEKENKILMFNDEGKFLKSIGGATGEVSGNRLKIQDAALDAQPQKALCLLQHNLPNHGVRPRPECGTDHPNGNSFARNRAGRKLPVCHPDIP